MRFGCRFFAALAGGAFVIFAPRAFALPDLVVTEIQVNYVHDEPEKRQFAATVENIGTSATPDGVVHGVSFWVDGEAVNWSDSHTSPLAPGASVTLHANDGRDGSAFWPPPVSREHDLMAWVDDVNRIDESDDTNNRLEETRAIAAGPLPDLLVSEIRVKRVGGDPDLRQFAATIVNLGDGPTPEGTIHGVSFWIGDEVVAWSDTWTESLQPGESAEVVANGGPDGSPYWHLPAAGEFEIMAWVDDVDRIDESRENNNQLTSRLHLGGPPPHPHRLQVTYPEREGDPVSISVIAEAEIMTSFQGDAYAVFYVNGDEVGAVPATMPEQPMTGIPAPWGEFHLEDAFLATSGDYTIAVEMEPGGERVERTFSLLPRTGQPDLVIQSVSYDHSVYWERSTPSVEVTNQGDAPTPAGELHRVDFYTNGERVAWAAEWTASIAPGETVTIVADGGPVGTPAFYPDPTHWLLEAVIDPQNRISESNEDNNSRETVLEMSRYRRGFWPWDLAVTSIEWTPSHPQPGDEVEFTATVSARWGQSAPNTDVELAFFVNGDLVAMAQPVPAETSVTEWAMSGTATWTATTGRHEVYAHVDPDDDISEDNFVNNILGRTLTVSGGYADWQRENFAASELDDPAISGPQARNASGVPNLMLYALGLSRDDSLTDAVAFARDAEGWNYTYWRPADREDIAYRVEASTDLVHWNVVEVVDTRIATADGMELWEARPASEDHPRLFFRLAVDESD